MTVLFYWVGVAFTALSVLAALVFGFALVIERWFQDRELRRTFFAFYVERLKAAKRTRIPGG